MLPKRDAELIQIVDRALADATQRARTLHGTSRLACRPGCTPCCHGVFRISALDAERLRTGLRALHNADPARAAAIWTRAADLAAVLSPHFPGDVRSGRLRPERGRGEEEGLQQDGPEEDNAWDSFADLPQADAPCPVLDPATGRCELYAARPLTCRIFGPPVQNESGIGVCELCYVGASDAEILAGEMHLQHQSLEAELDRELSDGETVIAWALLPLLQFD